MQLQLIRNATLRLNYGGRPFIIDPALAAKHSKPSYAGVSPNPLVDLPMPAEDVVSGIEMVIISHLHGDHFDPEAEALLPKTLPIFCQPANETDLREKGFEAVTPVEDSVTWAGLSLTRTPGEHGTGAWAERLGPVSGFVFRAENEPTVYWAGDTIWCEVVKRVIEETQPDIIITHSSGAILGDSGPIVMDAAQTIAVCQAAPQATVIATHLESLDHGMVSRAELREAAEAAGIQPDQLLIPADGETLKF
jgi:L-ascorbate metabolism protein UlaG (beta-lactamase superfamily)